ncbi:MAG: ATP-dependent Lhr-like helicase [Candidatus Woesearchaeota archaeon]|jgi:ATP-dependent Lhr-like helicase
MITHKTKADSVKKVTNLLHPAVRSWFFAKYPSFSQTQLLAVSHIYARENILVTAPTGSSKTLTGFLSILSELIGMDEVDILEDRVYAIYISPLKSLNYDIEYNLLGPLSQIQEHTDIPLNVRVATRTSDTTPYQRVKMLKKPPHILITTPESLALLLASKFKEHLKKIEWVIVDEIHAFAQNKRGTQLSLLLESLAKETEFSRVGLSATAQPKEEIAKFLVGDRTCTIASVTASKDINIDIFKPFKKYYQESFNDIQQRTLKKLHDTIQAHKSTLIFTNARSATEKLVHRLKDEYPEHYYEINEEPPFERSALIGAHHSSLSSDHRKTMETKLRDGNMRCIVCSTSLELGIDIGFIDHVVLLSSPKSVARLLQRIGRSGHKLHATVEATLIGQHPLEVFELTALKNMALQSEIDPITIPTLAYDVLTQWILSESMNGVNKEELFLRIKRSYPFFALQREQFEDLLLTVIEPFDDLQKNHVYPRIDVQGVHLQARGSTRLLYLQNCGTIVDTGGVRVKKGEQYLGTIDEEFASMLRPGDIFVLGGETYRFTRSNQMTIQVVDAHKRSPTVPVWKSGAIPLAPSVAKKMHSLFDEKMQTELLGEATKMDDLVIQYYVEGNYHYYIVEHIAGRAVNQTLAMIFEYAASRLFRAVMQTTVHDYGFVLMTQRRIDILQLFTRVSKEKSELLLQDFIEKTEIFKRRFRQCSVRSLFITKQYKQYKKTTGKQQFASHFLLPVIRSINAKHPIILSAKNEILQEQLATQQTDRMLPQLAKATIQEVATPSPIGMILLLAAYADSLTPLQKHQYEAQAHALRLRGKSFVYHDVRQAVTQKELTLADELDRVAKSIRMDSLLRFELHKVLDGDSGVSVETLDFLENFFEGAIPRIWTDRLVFSLKEKYLKLQ